MKYIRTKDGIIDLSRVTIGENGWESIEEYIAFKQEDQKELINQSDTIEELCDYYFGANEDGTINSVYNGSKSCYPKQPKIWYMDGFCSLEKTTIKTLKEYFPNGIFGAITWFEEGNLNIKVVAKMNEKGELELL